jgi:hypothetical protein
LPKKCGILGLLMEDRSEHELDCLWKTARQDNPARRIPLF